MKNKRGFSELRRTLELILFLIGLIAGFLLYFALFVNFDAETPYKDFNKTKLVLEEIKSQPFNSDSIITYVMTVLFVVLTIRFFLVITKAKK